MDVNQRGYRAAARVRDSLASTGAEHRHVDLLESRLASSDVEERQRVTEELVDLAILVERREQGRREPVLPRDPDEARTVLSGLRGFTDPIESRLEEQLEAVRTSRRAWATGTIVLAVGSSAVAAVAVFVILIADRNPSPALVACVGAAAAGLIASVVVTFRILQTKDETERRLNEKMLALAFLEASIELAADKPEAAPLIERSFDMFLAHYETGQSALSASDLVPK